METTTRSETPAGDGKASVNHDALNQLLGQMVNDLGSVSRRLGHDALCDSLNLRDCILG